MISRIRDLILNHKLVSILAVGTLIRIILMPISAHPFDVYIWYTLSSNILKNGPLSLEAFPPLWYHYMMVPIAYSYGWLSGILSSAPIPMSSLPSALNFYPSFNVQYVPGMLFDFIVKIPFFISDVALTILLYKIVGELTKSKKLAESAAFLWFLNPFVIWISAGWGMWDTLPALFSLAAFYFLLKKKISLSALCISLGVVLKLYPALFLVPIVAYLLKTSPSQDKVRNILKFFVVFVATSILLFLPYLNKIGTFFPTDYFSPSPATFGAVTNPISYPIGYGLSYWSLYSLNRLINIPVTATFVSLASIVSISLVVLALVLAYWRTYKITFEKSTYDLALVFLMPLVAFFLSYRIINEQYFVWIIPFLIILCIGGRFKLVYFWATSGIALAYAVLNCPLPYFFLPLAPRYTSTLLSMVYAVWAIDSERIALLAILGTVFSAVLISITFHLLKNRTDVLR